MSVSATDLLDLLGSDLNRHILERTSAEPCSAETIAEDCDASLPTVYRHVDDMQEAGLLTEHDAYDADGNHYKTYVAALASVRLDVDDGDLSVGAVDHTEPQTDADGSGPEGPEGPPSPDGVEPAGTSSDDDVQREE